MGARPEEVTPEEVTPEEISAQIAATRTRLGEDLDQLSEKINPGRVAARTAQDARAAAGNAVASVRERAGQHASVATVTRKAHERADHAAGAVRGQMNQMKEHPQVGRGALKVKKSLEWTTHAVQANAKRNPGATAVVVSTAILVPFALVALRRHRDHYVQRLQEHEGAGLPFLPAPTPAPAPAP